MCSGAKQTTASKPPSRKTRREDLHEVVLVGYSYGGMVMTGVAERVPERLAHLVYLDAFVPHDGESLIDSSRMEIS